MELFFILYFTFINLIYATLLLLSSISVYKRHKHLKISPIKDFFPSMTFIIPAYNEEHCIVHTVKQILNLSYPHKQVIIVNDGSTDTTLSLLQTHFQLHTTPALSLLPLLTAPINNCYESALYPEVLVVDKEHKGKFDAINAGINACKDPFFIVNDADTLIDDTCFQSLIHILFTNPNTIAIGASVRIKNGCTFQENRISTHTFPDSFLSAMQILEYLKCFLTRLGWDYVDGCFIISGAFSLFAKDAALAIGGFRSSFAEDMEIVVRLQRYIREGNRPYKIYHLPDPVSWTEGPNNLRALGTQRIRWHFGLLQTLWHHKDLMFNPKFGFLGLFIYPFWLFCEALEPIIEFTGLIYICATLALGTGNPLFIALFLFLSLGFNSLLTLICLLIEGLSFKRYPSFRLIIYTFLENFGYRQCNLLWRTCSFFKTAIKWRL